jgi:hypothetical protein
MTTSSRFSRTSHSFTIRAVVIPTGSSPGAGSPLVFCRWRWLPELVRSLRQAPQQSPSSDIPLTSTSQPAARQRSTDPASMMCLVPDGRLPTCSISARLGPCTDLVCRHEQGLHMLSSESKTAKSSGLVTTPVAASGSHAGSATAAPHASMVGCQLPQGSTTFRLQCSCWRLPDTNTRVSRSLTSSCGGVCRSQAPDGLPLVSSPD